MSNEATSVFKAFSGTMANFAFSRLSALNVCNEASDVKTTCTGSWQEAAADLRWCVLTASSTLA
eukprot:CAMPEP_0115313364 /NCGR_PEP_ID=MMETSP0270-20121206/76433_1 /TAXON_ID=71861 /ORGANISM="Scrippsiella trochoidea, Strain CCMP3099" /LENGTH=63 /DNA_ID=CAMNT_0002732465 /DNA_START=154 /DNA_END=341 /DNA_ORIENTATION=+